MNAALERLVRQLEAKKDLITSERLGAFESRYLELGTLANRAASDEEYLLVARRADMLRAEVEKASNTP